MPALESDLRCELENVIIEAREVAEAAARSKLTNLGVAAPEAFNERDREIRNRLRARGRQAGDLRKADKTQSIDQLSQEFAYEFWHRMLFARFLAENGLLIDPEHEVSVDLDYCEEVAASKGASNGYVLAARYASTMLPQIFRTDDVLLEIDFAPDQRVALEKLLVSIPQKTFLADDSLGWAYQFWQTEENKRVNKRVKSGEKVDGRTLPAVTQFFTEHYMVQFLLHNTIGAWWCGHHGIKGSPSHVGVSLGQSPVNMEYLRWRDDGSSVTGRFDGWPKNLAEFTMLDPYCGSGHFLVAAFNLLVPLRMRDDKLTAEKACEAVLRDNLFGLELDPRCTQIAAFALALAAWKYPDAGGYRPLPPLNIACSGQGVTGERTDWEKLANGNNNLRFTLGNLFDLFQKASHLGSLIDPRSVLGAASITGSLAEVHPLLVKAMTKYGGDVELKAIGVAAQGIAKAAEFLSRRYTLVITNVPYLGRHKQSPIIKEHCNDNFGLSKANLATALLERSLSLCEESCTAALVTPQAWLLQGAYEDLREAILEQRGLLCICRLGPKSFETISGEVVNVALVIIDQDYREDNSFALLDATGEQGIPAKADFVRSGLVEWVDQDDQKNNPDSVIGFSPDRSIPLLNKYASAYQGLCTSDDPQFVFCFWEPGRLTDDWKYLQTAAAKSGTIGGCSSVLYWQGGQGRYFSHAMALKKEGRLGGWKSGGKAWGKRGIGVNVTSNQFVNLYTGEFFDNTVAAIIPNEQDQFQAIVSFLRSEDYRESVQELAQALSITEHTLLKVPFDLAAWDDSDGSSSESGGEVLASNDPTQWLFTGDIAACTDPLQVAVARLLGYRWPEQPKPVSGAFKSAHFCAVARPSAARACEHFFATNSLSYR